MRKLISKFALLWRPLDHPMAQHPLFKHELRGMRWQANDAALRGRAIRGSMFGLLTVIIGWSVFALPSLSVYRSYYRGEDVLVFFFFVTLAFGLHLDFSGFAAALNSITGEVSSRRWDLLRLTLLNQQSIVLMKHLAAQVRCWRLLWFNIGLRIGLCLIGMVILVPPLIEQGIDLGSLLVLFAAIGIISSVFIAEAFWRLDCMTALGVYVSSLNRSPTSTWMTGVFFLVLGWILGVFVVGGAGFGSLSMASVTTLVLISGTPMALAALIYNFLFIALFVSAVYGFFYLSKRWFMRRAYRRVLLID